MLEVGAGRESDRPPPTSSRVRHLLGRPLLLLLLSLGLAAAPAAQTPGPPLAPLVERLARLTAVTGYEQSLADTLLALLPRSARDRAGNVVLAGHESRVVLACPMDEPGWVVGGVRPDGYLTVRRSPGGSPEGRDPQLEGARVEIHGRRGVVPAVVAVRSIHLTRGRDRADAPFTADSAYLDAGATSAGEVAELGIGVLSVVALAKRPHRYGRNLLAAPSAGRRAACAALLHAARAKGAAGATVAFVVEQDLRQRGLATLAHERGPFGETVIVDAEGGASVATPSLPGLGRITRLGLPVRYAGTPVETVSLQDVARLREAIAAKLEDRR